MDQLVGATPPRSGPQLPHPAGSAEEAPPLVPRKLAELNASIALLSSTIIGRSARRGQIRVQARREQGHQLERCKAIALEVHSMVWRKLDEKAMADASDRGAETSPESVGAGSCFALGSCPRSPAATRTLSEVVAWDWRSRVPVRGSAGGGHGSVAARKGLFHGQFQIGLYGGHRAIAHPMGAERLGSTTNPETRWLSVLPVKATGATAAAPVAPLPLPQQVQASDELDASVDGGRRCPPFRWSSFCSDASGPGGVGAAALTGRTAGGLQAARRGDAALWIHVSPGRQAWQ